MNPIVQEGVPMLASHVRFQICLTPWTWSEHAGVRFPRRWIPT